MKQIFSKVEPEPGQTDCAGSSQIPRLRASPAPTPCQNIKNFFTFCKAVKQILYFSVNFEQFFTFRKHFTPLDQDAHLDSDPHLDSYGDRCGSRISGSALQPMRIHITD